MRILLVIFSILPFSIASCPSTSWELVSKGECRKGVDSNLLYHYDEVVDKIVSKCQEYHAHPVFIHNDEQQSYYPHKASPRPIPIGLVCNTHSKRWEWIDGSMLDYKPSSSNYDEELDQDCTTGSKYGSPSLHFAQSLASLTGEGVWEIKRRRPVFRAIVTGLITVNNRRYLLTYGVLFKWKSQNRKTATISTMTVMTASVIRSEQPNWQDAQMECRQYGADLASIHNDQENSFIRRLAVSKGTVNGVFLGATISGKGSGFGWIDGSAWDYENFYPGFPIDGFGDCLSMDTLGVAGQWMNMDCSSKLAVACIRQPNASYTDSSSSGPWKEGQIIYSPGYPYDASVPCDYFLTVDAGKKVEVKVQLLEANTCCDHLILTDNYLAGNIVANLTGEISSKTYTTKSSNLMRVSWQPNGGVNVRGFMMSYRAV